MTASNPSAQTRQLEALRHVMATRDVFGIAEELAHVDPQVRATAFRLLSPEQALEVFQHLDAVHQEALLRELLEAQADQLVEAMAPDDRVRLGES